MKTKFGPWAVEKELKTEYCSRTGVKKEYTNFWVSDLDDASITLFTDQYSKQENMNELASLVAAAPEMYEALVKIRVLMGQIEGKATTQSFEAASIIANVLKKARGEENP